MTEAARDFMEPIRRSAGSLLSFDRINSCRAGASGMLCRVMSPAAEQDKQRSPTSFETAG